MVLFTTLSRYIARQFILYFTTMLLVLSSIIILFEFIEMVRRISDRPEATLGVALQLTLFKVPQTIELLFHFAVLFSAMFTFWRLTRSNELVVARGAGVSVWQFIAPVLVAAALIGALRVSVLNPVGALLYARFDALERHYIYGLSNVIDISPNGLWLRQDDADGSSIFFAERAEPGQLLLHQVVIFQYDANGRYRGRIDAATAALHPGYWELHDTWSSLGTVPQRHVAEIHWPTPLTPESIQDSFASPQRLSFWRLPAFIRVLQRVGFSTVRHRLHYQSLLAQPLLLVAMVLFAAAFSLRLTRRGGHLLLVVAGVATGFMLFVMNDVMRAFGLTETIPVALAAWTPAVVSTLVGTAMLLYLEDG